MNASVCLSERDFLDMRSSVKCQRSDKLSLLRDSIGTISIQETAVSTNFVQMVDPING